ncbi:unnamed protein product [Adineta steineri]|uniref:Uncharacterized protein n=1 Tax=Adineta steineri TaxID=433720 RepID=A0A814DEQ3_9BILA|nr:unnamed protein product [Adineta steineri]CAF4132340.1 unnamed protein product [Adineta steineri]
MNTVQLSCLLSYVPQLRYLSAHLLRGYDFTQPNLLNINSIHLTYASLKFKSKAFDIFEQFFINHFPSIEVLCITSDIGYRDIRSAAFHEQIHLFQSSFWTERKWFFRSQLEETVYGEYRIFYSTNSYTRNDYELHSEITAENKNRIIFKSVHHMEIKNEKIMDQCMDYFPNITKLTLKDYFFVNGLSRIFPLQQLKT